MTAFYGKHPCTEGNIGRQYLCQIATYRQFFKKPWLTPHNHCVVGDRMFLSNLLIHITLSDGIDMTTICRPRPTAAASQARHKDFPALTQSRA
jgi:hypothetical protein